MEIDFRGRMERRGRGGGIISALMMTHSQLMSQSFTCNIVSYKNRIIKISILGKPSEKIIGHVYYTKLQEECYSLYFNTTLNQN